MDEESRIDICCACSKEMADTADHCYMNFRYKVPGSGLADQVLVAVVCEECANEADQEKFFPVLEAMINAKIIRIENPDKSFKPE